MRIDLISAVPDLMRSPIENSIIKRARESGHVEIVLHDLHDYTTDKHGRIDDYAYGGGAGMVMTPQPIFDCVESLKTERDYGEIIFTAPDGDAFTQQEANRLSLVENIIILCGHYKGVDQRVRDSVITREYRIGDVVLSGGELPALMMVDAVVRLIPGTLGDSESALDDAFMDGLLAAPEYTRPAVYRGMKVPEVLQSGDHSKITRWKEEQAIGKTRRLRPDLMEKFEN
ncbi:MAG TPA: tRNA (guanosine(37)-N1)-methyltransferase TrmD [Balneolales bacterium]|nr:tRNA (guanosine(37)-N1)-methyltransferase TrmD [Balneolales bacterium]